METNYEALQKAHSAFARERVLADLRTLTRDAEDLLKATAHDLGEKVKEARLRLGGAVERAKATCGYLQEQSAMAAKKADTVIREHPYEAIGVAFGLGLLIGVLVRRR
jgi:ElaB/YqjD/DUF883 family membrane-anchored ribosome-binding protein